MDLSEASTKLQEATDASNEWRSHAFRELRAFEVPSGVEIAAGDLVGAVQIREASLQEVSSIWRPAAVSRLEVRGVDRSSEDPDTPRISDLDEIVDTWLAMDEAGTFLEAGEETFDNSPATDARAVLEIELPIAVRGASRLLASRGFQPVSSLAVRKISDADLVEPRRSGVKLRRVVASDRDALLSLMRELHLAEVEAGNASEHDQVEEHLLTYIDRIIAAPDLAWVAHYFGMLTGVAAFGRDGDAVFSNYERERNVEFAVVTRRMRAGGIGHALVDALHSDAAKAGTEASTVTYSVMNPESAAFWHRRGYRPLTTLWRRVAR